MKTNQTNTKEWSAKTTDQTNTKNGKVHNLLIVDESGSMHSLYKAALSGMNETLQTIRKAAKDYPLQHQEVTLITFNTTHYNQIFNSTQALDTRDIRSDEYRPYGGTPLFDAMGRGITELANKVKAGDKVLVTIITDGMENSSCEYSLAVIKALVNKLSEAGWIFTYIGANQDAVMVAKSMNIDNALNYNASPEAMTEMWTHENERRTAFYESAYCEDYDNSLWKDSYFTNKRK